MATPRTRGLMTGSLEEKAMLVKFSQGRWSARKKDKLAGKEVEARFKTEHGQTQVTKALTAKNALKTINGKLDYAYNYYISKTLPWTDDGMRILSSAMYTEFMSVMRTLKDDVLAEVKVVETNYDAIRQEALISLGGYVDQGGLFDPADYPTDIASKYKFDVNIMPIPMKADFRVTTLSDDALAEIESQIEQRYMAAEKGAMDDLYKRVREMMAAVYEAFNDPNCNFHDSTIHKLTDLMEMVPKLNIGGSKELDQTRKIIETKICTLDGKALRSDINARKSAADDARAILTAMSEYC